MDVSIVIDWHYVYHTSIFKQWNNC